MNYSANKMAAKHCLSAQCIVVDIVPLTILEIPLLSTLVPEVYFYYFHCEGERKNKPLEPG
jgi:hypothetical protein